MDIHVAGARELEDLAKKLKKHGRGGSLQKDLAQQVQIASGPIKPALQAAVMRVIPQQIVPPPTGRPRRRRSTQLRARTAAAVEIGWNRTGARIRVNAAKVDPDGYGVTLPRYLDSELTKYRRWRHPVFNDRTADWVEQRGFPWFFVTIRSFEARITRSVRKAMDKVADDITR